MLASARAKKCEIAKEITLQASDRGFVPTLMSINSLQMDSLMNTCLVVTDLTEHMEEEVKKYTSELELAQIALSESEQRWATTLASIGDAVIAADISGKITFMNGVAEKLTGWPLNEASRRPVPEIFKIFNEFTRKIVEDPVAKVLKKGIVVGLANHTILVRKDGTEVAIDDSGAPIRDKKGKITGVVLIFRDITERKQMEAKLEEYRKHLEDLVEERTKQLRDAERFADIGKTAGMVGHDIRNPLQAIVGDLFLAKQELESTSDDEKRKSMKESLDAIDENVEYINKIVTDLQDFSKPLKPCAEETNLNSIISELLQKNRLPKNVQHEVRIENKARTMIADSTYMKRILGNLISNAVQAMPNGGKLNIHAYGEEQNVVITVEDTGVGIPEEARSKLFTPLFTTKARGQGFGLAVVKRMTEALNGTVSFESQVGKGTTFTIRLPPPRNKR
jgi:PAS domain S-box-containing protein